MKKTKNKRLIKLDDFVGKLYYFPTIRNENKNKQ